MTEYRICNICGKKNTPDLWMCECGNIISGLPVVSSDEAAEKQEGFCEFCGEYFDENEDECPFCFKKRASVLKKEHYYFVSCLGKKLEIPNGTSEIGRSGLMSNMLCDANAFAVSEKHIILKNENDVISIVDISRNGTFVNGSKLPKDEQYILNIGDEICLGGIPGIGDKYSFSIILTKE